MAQQMEMETTLPPDRPARGESLNDFCRRHYGPHRGQQEFVNDPAMFRAAIAGIGGGKTEVGAFEAIRHCVRWPGMRGLVIAPTYRMLWRSTRLVLLKVASWWGDALGVKEHKAEARLELTNLRDANGECSCIYFGHAQDPNSLRALEVGYFWIDEAPLCSQEAFRVAMGRIRQPGVPHRGWITGTPKGRNWVYRTFVEEREAWAAKRRKAYGFHTWRTHDNPLYETEPDFLAALEAEYGTGTDFYRQELEASFVTFAGLVYKDYDAARHDIPGPTPRFVRVAAGVDWGYRSPGCIVVLGEDGAGNVWLVDEVYERNRIVAGKPGDDWVSDAIELRKRWGIQAFFCDPEDANAIQQFLMAGLPAFRANNARMPGVKAVQALLATTRLRVLTTVGPDGIPESAAPNVVSEFGQYHWRTDRDGNPVEDADPSKEFDHAMDALRYAVMGMALATDDGTTVYADDLLPGFEAEQLGAARL